MVSICDTCAQAVPSKEVQQVDLHFECMVCRGLKAHNTSQTQYFSAADLAEDYGIYDPQESGYWHVVGLGWTRS